MTLIKCPECGHQVSNQAQKCMNCGVPINLINENQIINLNNTTPSIIKKNFPFLGILAISLGVISLILPSGIDLFILPIAVIISILAFAKGNKKLGAIALSLAFLGLVVCFKSFYYNKYAIQQLEKTQTTLEEQVRSNQ